MATPAQIRANRLNALRSTGPRTPAGKARSSQNARRHGLRSRTPPLPPVDHQAFSALLQDFRASLRPSNPAEDDLVAEMALRASRLDQWQRLEDALLASGKSLVEAARNALPLARRLTSAEMSFHRALYQFLALRTPRRPRGRPRKSQNLHERTQSPLATMTL